METGTSLCKNSMECLKFPVPLVSCVNSGPDTLLRGGPAVGRSIYTGMMMNDDGSLSDPRSLNLVLTRDAVMEL